MKRWGWILAILFLAAGVTAQTLDQPVATIKLDKKTSLVGQKTFRDQVAAWESSRSTKMDQATKTALLQELVTAELIRMDMEAKGIKATDEDLLRQFRAKNPGLTDAQIRTEVEKQSGKAWDDAVAPLKQQFANMKYFPEAQKIGEMTVSDQEVKDFYEANTALFTAPDFVRVSHIFFDTKVKPKGSLAEIQKKADDTLAKIKSGANTFEDEVKAVSDDTGSAKSLGDIGYLPRTLESQVGQQLLNIFGKDFLNSVFALKKGAISEVLTSNSGLHIVRVTEKVDKHFMTLDEPVYPGREGTVRQAISQTLLQRKQASAYAKMVSAAGETLRKNAVIKLFEQNY